MSILANSDGALDRVEVPHLLKQDLNDAGNSERFCHTYERYVLFCTTLNVWFLWDGRRWRRVCLAIIMRLAMRVAKWFIEQARKAFRESDEDDERLRKILKFANRSNDRRGLEAMLRLVQARRAIQVEAFDRDPWLLNCLNGTIDLRTGQLRPHRRKDYITRLVHLNYNPEAQCPTFLKFVQRIMAIRPGASPEQLETARKRLAYLQKLSGYACTGDVSEKAFFLLIGDGDNGKTTLVEALRSVIAEYSIKLQVDTLMLYRNRENATSLAELADLKGMRLAVTSEVEATMTLAVSKMKDLSGTGRVKACKKYGHPFEFHATHKILIDANHLPAVPGGGDEAFWSRVKILCFHEVIPPHERNRRLLHDLREEGEGILGWLVEGAKRWYQEGLGEPPDMTTTVEGWRRKTDPLTEFIEEECVISSGACCQAAHLRSAYLAYADHAGESPLPAKTMNERLEKMGLRRGTRRFSLPYPERAWLGIGLQKLQESHEM